MVDKLHEYEGLAGRVHDVRDKFKEKWETWKEWKNGIPMDQGIEGFLNHLRGPPKLERSLDDYAHIYRYVNSLFSYSFSFFLSFSFISLHPTRPDS